eukprot:29120-Pelagococcus_subviridis.AAC.16
MRIRVNHREEIRLSLDAPRARRPRSAPLPLESDRTRVRTIRALPRARVWPRANARSRGRSVRTGSRGAKIPGSRPG